MTLRWTAPDIGCPYQVEGSTNLTTWNPMPGGRFTSTAAGQVSFSTPTSGTAGFFRVKVLAD